MNDRVFIVVERVRVFTGAISDLIIHVCASEEIALKKVKNYICPYPNMKETEPGEGNEQTFKDRHGNCIHLYILQREVEKE